MKHILNYKIFEADQKFSSRDVTNKYRVGNEWIRYTSQFKLQDEYIEIEKDFGINYDELGEILQEFVEEYNLLYDCISTRQSIEVFFHPYNNDYMVDDPKRPQTYIESQIGRNHNWNEDILKEMNDRLSEYGLTIMDKYGNYQFKIFFKFILRITRI